MTRLEDIIEHKRGELEQLRASVDLAELEARAGELYRPPGRFAGALCRAGINVIAEVKRRSPSSGDINVSVDPAQQARSYLAGGAVALSVVTDERFFGGSLDDLRAVREACPGAPILRKDFTLDRMHVAEAAVAGADAVLLIAGVLDLVRINDLVAYAWELGLDALVEAHSGIELDLALASNAMLVGINNRDLTTFDTDISRTVRHARRVPADRILVTESGIEDAADITTLAQAGVDGYLVGTALMRTGDPARLLAYMTAVPDQSRPINVSVKLCGLRTEEDTMAALAAGADMLGMVFTDSPRQVSPRNAKTMVDIVAGTRVTVGVFAGEDADMINAIAAGTGIDVVQLSGGDRTRVAAIERDVMPKVPMHALESKLDTEYVLVDTQAMGVAGGSGRAFLWSFLRGRPHSRVMLAGGLTPENVAAAVRVVRPGIVDTSSGTEINGAKDARRMHVFVQAARGAVLRRAEVRGPETAAAPGEGLGIDGPDARGRFGEFGGMFVPETLMAAVHELVDAYQAARADPAFGDELDHLLHTYVGRPTPLYHARNLTAHADGAQIWLKREDLAHTGAHKINNALGQALLAQRMGKRRIIAETGAGQHGVAAATVCALLGLDCIVYMGEQDIERQKPNVFRMQLLGAEVRPVADGTRTLKDAVNAAIRDWVTNVNTTFYIIGSVVGMHPYPMIVRDFQSVIGTELRTQFLDTVPDAIVACVGGGSNAIGIFHAFVNEPSVRLFGAEAGGHGIDSGQHAATLVAGEVGVLHGSRSYVLQDADGQVTGTHSISAGLDYPGVGPEHAQLKDSGRAEYRAVTDIQALDALRLLCRTEGIICALESAHAISLAVDVAADMGADENVVVCLSGRGDKDLATIIAHQPDRGDAPAHQPDRGDAPGGGAARR